MMDKGGYEEVLVIIFLWDTLSQSRPKEPPLEVGACRAHLDCYWEIKLSLFEIVEFFIFLLSKLNMKCKTLSHHLK